MRRCLFRTRRPKPAALFRDACASGRQAWPAAAPLCQSRAEQAVPLSQAVLFEQGRASRLRTRPSSVRRLSASAAIQAW